MKDINFILTKETAEDICEHYGRSIEDMDDWEVCELLDRLIGEALFEKE